MPSSVEHLFGNFSWSAWRRAHSLRRGLLFLLVAFIAMRVGTFIPLPGVNGDAWAASFAHLGWAFHW